MSITFISFSKEYGIEERLNKTQGQRITSIISSIYTTVSRWNCFDLIHTMLCFSCFGKTVTPLNICLSEGSSIGSRQPSMTQAWAGRPPQQLHPPPLAGTRCAGTCENALRGSLRDSIGAAGLSEKTRTSSWRLTIMCWVFHQIRLLKIMNGKYILLYLFKFLVIFLGEMSRIYGPKGMNILKAVDPFCQIALLKE